MCTKQNETTQEQHEQIIRTGRELAKMMRNAVRLINKSAMENNQNANQVCEATTHMLRSIAELAHADTVLGEVLRAEVFHKPLRGAATCYQEGQDKHCCKSQRRHIQRIQPRVPPRFCPASVARHHAFAHSGSSTLALSAWCSASRYAPSLHSAAARLEWHLAACADSALWTSTASDCRYKVTALS